MTGPANESAYRAASDAAAVYDSGREVLRVTGEDRVSFLHGMVTNDVNGLAVGAVNEASMLTPKGQMVGHLRVWKREREVLLDTEPGQGEAVKAFLDKYLISEDAEVSLISSEQKVICVLGPRAADAMVEGIVEGIRGPSLLPGRPGVDFIAARATPLPALPLLDEATFEVLRVEAGIPRFGRDMDESTIPLEANLERAIHYQKGCYIGQEVIARATFRGHMNRKLVGLLLGSLEPTAKTELRAGEKKVGWITTVVPSIALKQNVALGYVHRDFVDGGRKLQLASGGEADVRPLPLVETHAPA